jgi:hypothetical protein
MSETGTVRRTGKQKLAGAKSGELVTEARAAKVLGISRRRLLIAVRTGLVFSFWARGQRFVILP